MAATFFARICIPRRVTLSRDGATGPCEVVRCVCSTSVMPTINLHNRLTAWHAQQWRDLHSLTSFYCSCNHPASLYTISPCKRLSYDRDSASRRSLGRSRSFKVTYVSTNWKPVCDFLLVNNINLHYISRSVFQLPLPRRHAVGLAVKLSPLIRGCLSLTHSFSVTSVNIAVNHILLKTESCGLHFCFKQYGSIFNHCDVIGPKATELGRITQNSGHYAIRGHSKSPILVPIESPFATSY